MFTIVVLPDIQSYSDTRKKVVQGLFNVEDQRYNLFEQVRWIIANKKELNIAMVIQEGDLTQTNHKDEWEISESAFRCLDDVVPYVVCIGNHDQGYDANPPPDKVWISNRRDSMLNDYFPFLKPLGPSRPYVVLMHDFQHARASLSRQRRNREDGQTYYRHYHLADTLAKIFKW